MLKRTFDPAALNEVANHPQVRPLMGGEGPIDLSEVLADPRTIGLIGEGGGFIVMPLYDFTYECHTILRPKIPPRRAVAMAKAGLEYMYVNTPCEEIITKVADNNLGAMWLAESVGFLHRFHRQDAWKEGVGVTYLNQNLDTWVHTCSTLAERGREFHDQLEAAKTASGSSLPVHPDDEAHDRAVGAAVAMILNGNITKGVAAYNRWALFTGYQPISVLSASPLVIDVVDAVVGVTNGRMEVLQCR